MSNRDDEIRLLAVDFAKYFNFSIEETVEALNRLGEAASAYGVETRQLANALATWPTVHTEPRIGNTHKQYPTSTPPWARKKR